MTSTHTPDPVAVAVRRRQMAAQIEHPFAVPPAPRRRSDNIVRFAAAAPAKQRGRMLWLLALAIAALVVALAVAGRRAPADPTMRSGGVPVTQDDLLF